MWSYDSPKYPDWYLYKRKEKDLEAEIQRIHTREKVMKTETETGAM